MLMDGRGQTDKTRWPDVDKCGMEWQQMSDVMKRTDGDYANNNTIERSAFTSSTAMAF